MASLDKATLAAIFGSGALNNGQDPLVNADQDIFGTLSRAVGKPVQAAAPVSDVNTGRDLASMLSRGSSIGTTYAPQGGGASSANIFSNPNLLAKVLNSSAVSPQNAALSAMGSRPQSSANDYLSAMYYRPSSGAPAQVSGGGAYGAAGGGGGSMGGGMGQMAQMLAGSMGQQQQAAPEAPKLPEKPKTFDQLHPNGTPSGPNYHDPRAPLTFTGGGYPSGDDQHGQGLIRDMLAQPPPPPHAPPPAGAPASPTPAATEEDKPSKPKSSKPKGGKSAWPSMGGGARAGGFGRGGFGGFFGR